MLNLTSKLKAKNLSFCVHFINCACLQFCTSLWVPQLVISFATARRWKMMHICDHAQLVQAFILLACLNQFSAAPPTTAPPVKLISNDVEHFLNHFGCKNIPARLLETLLQPLGFAVQQEGLKNDATCTRIYPEYEHTSLPDPVGELCALAFSTLREVCSTNSHGGGPDISPASVAKPRTAVTLDEVCTTLSTWVKSQTAEQDRSLNVYGDNCKETCAEGGNANQDCYGLYRGRRLLQVLRDPGMY